MADENGQNADANATSVQDAGISSITGASFQRPDVTVDLVSTIDDDSGKGASGAKTADLAGAAEGGKDGDDKGAGEEGKSGNFHDHPDWQRMMKERDDARIEAAAAKARLEEREKFTAKPAGNAEPENLPFKDITKMSKEELLEWFEDDPVGYEANRMAQLKHETRQSLKNEDAVASRTKTIEQTFKTYEEKNPDFKTMWDSGEIEKFMADHPGHNAISAHKELTEEKRMQDAISKAIKETEERVTKNFQAKRSAAVISEGGGSSPLKTVPDELKDTKSHGGLVSAITSRLQRLRQASAGG